MTDYLKELADLAPINRGVGWYWRRCGELGVVTLDCPEAVESPLLGYAIVDDGRFDVAGWSKDGSFGLGGDDLVLFIGPAKPEQATYNEWRAAEVAEPLLDWWCVKNSYGAQHFDTLAEAKLFARGRASHKIIHMREVREPSQLPPLMTPGTIQHAVLNAVIKCFVRELSTPASPEILADAGLPPCEPMQPAVIPAEPAEPVAEREPVERWLVMHQGCTYYVCSSREHAKSLASGRSIVHVREVPEGEEVRCWTIPGYSTTSESIAEYWRASNVGEVVECVGYRRKAVK